MRVRARGIGWLAVAIAIASGGPARAQQIDVSGTWNVCLGPDTSNGGVQRPVATFTQLGTHVSGTMSYPFFQSTLTCLVGFEIDSATGVFVPGTATESCPLNVHVGPRLALASRDRIDGEFGAEFARRWLYGLRACDPMTPNACDDGDPSTTDVCTASVDCFAVALAPSCVHTGCTSDADCADPYACTFDRCDATTGCAHETVLTAGDPRAFCEDADACTADTQCDLATCGSGEFTATVTSMTGPRLTLGHLGGTSGDDTIAVKGRVVLPAPITIDPAQNGIRVSVVDAQGATVLDDWVPGGAFNVLTGIGWSSSGKGIRYVDKRKAGQGPIRKVTIKSDLGTPGLVRVAIAGKAGSYAAGPALPLGLFVNLDVGLFATPALPLDVDPLNGGACARFGDPPFACTSSSAGTKIRCR